ncbi:GNAT family N-acetyltransferase [Chitinimonas viridis]|uniref:GNAT family N-acetyltransferase n=1 Tax=Chitinimonas viridis TaxID=664880 RepID=A0ABT8B719_9NEIS|nr:GNAT family N-acetyltransferase [Chitinimonas viridis]MDN3577800.1 GNAT family N-acetyltransferase [Chitinimonas viridis]
MDIQLRDHCDQLGTAELEALFAAAGLGGRKGDKIRRAFLNSQLVCLAYAGGHLVGASRALTDGEYHGFIYDVAVHPDYQGRGLGQRLMQSLLDRLPVYRVMLIADQDVQGFYRTLGFDKHGDAMARFDRDRLYDLATTEHQA